MTFRPTGSWLTVFVRFVYIIDPADTYQRLVLRYRPVLVISV